MSNKIQKFLLLFTNKINNNKVIFQNISYITFLEVFIIATPLITYPYLVRVLGSELYGLVITSQVVAGIASIFINFGFKRVSAKHVSIHRADINKLSEIFSSVLIVRTFIWFLSFIVYMLVVYHVPLYNEHLLLFFFSFGLTFNELLFHQYFFQGIEKMKFITLINVLIRSFFVVMIFVLVNDAEDYIMVPLYNAIGYFFGGVLSLYIMYKYEKIKFFIPKMEAIKFYTMDASPIFATKVMSTIKDKFSYILLGSFVGMSEVVIYDLGMKFTNVLVKPITIIATVLFPRMAKEQSLALFNKIFKGSLGGMIIVISISNFLLPYAVEFFISENIDLNPLRIFLLAPLFLALSSFIASNKIIAFGYNKYIFKSIIVTTVFYISFVGVSYILGLLYSVKAFIIITVSTYFVELLYRLYVSKLINRNEAPNL